MKKPDQHGVVRPIVALVAALSFVFSPFAALAQQPDGEQADQQDQEEADASRPSGPTPKVVLLPTHGVRGGMSSIIPERIGEKVRGQLESKSAIELLPSFEKSLRQSDGQANAAVVEAERLYTSGIGLLTAGEDKKAAESFQKAVDMMEEHLTELQNFNVLADAYKNLALAYFNAGFDFDARKKMKVFAHLRPDAKLDPEQFPKKLRKLFDSESSKAKKGGPGKLIVDSDAEGATVIIDGDEKGSVPATVEDVGYGYHYLVVRAPDGTAKGEQIRVRGRGKKQEFKLELGATGQSAEDDGSELPAFYTGLLETIKTGNFGEDLEPYLAELITRSGAGYVAWAVVIKRNMKYEAIAFVYRASDSRLVQAEPVEFNIELSNLRVGVSRLAGRIVEAVETMPEDKAVSSVALAAPPEPTVEPGEGEDDQEAVAERQEEAADTEAPVEDAPEDEQGEESEEAASVTPPPVPSDKQAESNRWIWIGTGTAALLVTGLVAGGLIYMSDDGGTQPQGFDATLSW